MIEPHIPNVRQRKLRPSGHTGARSSLTPADRYIIRRGGLTGLWLVEDTMAGGYIGDGHRVKADAVRVADELNGGSRHANA